MFARIIVFLLALCGPCSAASINAANFAVGFTGNQQQPSSGTHWSTLGVIADSNGTSGNGTDNATAINAIDPATNPVVIGDCPAGGGIRIASRWFLKSNLQLYMEPGCKVYCDWVTTQVGAGCMTQANVATPISNVLINGLYFQLIPPFPTYLGKALRFYIDHLTFTNLTLDGFCSGMYVRGSDQEWQFNYLNSPCGAGNNVEPMKSRNASTDAFRHFGNSPKQATTAGRPANVWVHASTIFNSGDGALQVAPACQDGSSFSDLNADDYLYESSYASNGTAGVVLLLGNGAQTSAGLSCTNQITNIVIRSITGASSSGVIKVQNSSGSSTAINGMTISNIVADLSPQSSGSTASPIFIRGYDNAQILNLSISNVTFTGVYGLCIDMSAWPTSNILFDSITCPVPRAGNQPGMVIRATSGVTVRNSTIASRVSNGIQMGPGPTGSGLLNRVNGGNFTVQSATIQNNVISNISNNVSGLYLQNATGASVTGNVVTQKSGQTLSIGATLGTASGSLPGATTSTVTGNTMNTGTGVVCAPPAQGNTVNSNTGAAACP